MFGARSYTDNHRQSEKEWENGMTKRIALGAMLLFLSLGFLSCSGARRTVKARAKRMVAVRLSPRKSPKWK